MTDQTQPTDDLQTDEGVPVGDADVRADIEQGSGDDRGEPDTDDFLQQGAVEMSRDEGEAVGTADVDADRRNASGE